MYDEPNEKEKQREAERKTQRGMDVKKTRGKKNVLDMCVFFF